MRILTGARLTDNQLQAPGESSTIKHREQTKTSVGWSSIHGSCLHPLRIVCHALQTAITVSYGPHMLPLAWSVIREPASEGDRGFL
jgi:hypothetical protein